MCMGGVVAENLFFRAYSYIRYRVLYLIPRMLGRGDVSSLPALPYLLILKIG